MMPMNSPDLTQLILKATKRSKELVETHEMVVRPYNPPASNYERTSSEKDERRGKMECLSKETPRPLIKNSDNMAVIQKVDNMVGSLRFKELCHEISNRAWSIRSNNTQEFFFSTAYLFSVNSGSGYKTSLMFLEELLKETELILTPADRKDYLLPEPLDPDAAQKINNIIGTLEYTLSVPRVVTFDISSWLGYTGNKKFKNLLMYIFQHNTRCVVVFRIPYVREKLLAETNADMSDIISTRTVVFEPFTNEELHQIANRIIAPYGIYFSPDAAEKFDQRIEKEKSNGFFYGIHTVKKIVGDFIREVELQEQHNGIASKTITGSVIERTTVPEAINDCESDFDDFSNMIGMEVVERRLREVIYQIQFARRSGLSSKPCMHMFFVGNPGTGKTTVARMLGNELRKQGVLRVGKFYEHKGRDLCAEYVGQTTPKTTALCAQAYGSVLFIDEAYSLAGTNNQNDYGKEAVDALIAEMENHYDDLVVIFAGYPEDMEKLLTVNPGMRSRVPYTILFPNYSREELFEIFDRLSSAHFVHAAGFDEHAKSFFNSLPQELLNDKSFGNARFVRNIYERVWGKASARCARCGNACIELTEEDFDSAVAEFGF